MGRNNECIKTRAGTYYRNYFDPKTFLDKSTVLYGATTTGKSFILNDIINCVKDKVLFGIFMSKTAESDASFPCDKYTSSSFIHTKFDINVIRGILDASNKRSQLHQKAMDIERIEQCLPIIKKIYREHGLVKDLRTFDSVLRKCKKLYKSRNEARTKDDREEISKEILKFYRYLTTTCYKKIIKHRISLEKYNPITLIPITSAKINPRILFVINDVGSEPKSLKPADRSTFSEIFTQGRHYHITFVYLLHNARFVHPNDRDAPHNNIFTTPDALLDWVNLRKLSHIKKMAGDVADVMHKDDRAPKGKKQFLKILYTKDDGKISYLCADPLGKQRIIGNKRLLVQLKKSEKTRDESDQECEKLKMIS